MIPNNLRILIIDDNQEIQQDFIKILSKADASEKTEMDDIGKSLFGEEVVKKSLLPEFVIDVASQGKEGVERILTAKNEGKPYSLAFVDIRMPPGWDGIETIKHIWEIDKDIQIVICTAYSDYSWEETIEALGEGENLLILKKPFDYIAVRQLAMTLTKKWALLQQTREQTKELEEKVKERTKSLEESLSITRGTLESSIDALLVINIENTIINYNKKLIALWKIPDTILEEKNGFDLLMHISNFFEQPILFIDQINELINNPDEIKLDKLKCIDGRIIEHYSQPYKQKENIEGRVWCFRDITKRIELEEKVKFQATHDSLTYLPNREYIIDLIQHNIKKSTQEMAKFAIMFFDLDRFKLVNDSYDHTVGDDLLRSVANRIRQNLRENDKIARLGGDEFIFFTANYKSQEALRKIGNKLLGLFKEPFKLPNRKFSINCSIGVSVFPENGKTVEELIRNADLAMYRAKELGGGQIQFYDTKLNQETLRELEMETDFQLAIKNKEFFLCYQPQFELTTNKLISMEALIRWRHPKKGVILPLDFIPLAEETGFIVQLSEWVLKTACKQNKAWQDMGLPSVRMGVNITTKVLKQPHFIELVKKVLKETSLKPEYLEIELTENIILTSIEAKNKISQLRDIGVSIAVDDFGAGYSSLNYIGKIPLDRLKIDQSFIKNIDLGRSDKIIIQAIITMAKSMDLDLIAEGIETQEQLDFLKTKRCCEGQGFFLSSPLEAKQMQELLAGILEDVTK